MGDTCDFLASISELIIEFCPGLIFSPCATTTSAGNATLQLKSLHRLFAFILIYYLYIYMSFLLCLYINLLLNYHNPATTFGLGYLEAAVARCCPTSISQYLVCHRKKEGGGDGSRRGDDGVFIITGGNRGVGYETARILLSRGRSVIILSRNKVKGDEAALRLSEETGNGSCSCYQIDLSDFGSILEFLKVVEEKSIVIHGLINNAGAISGDAMMSNHFGHFALTLGLLPGKLN